MLFELLLITHDKINVKYAKLLLACVGANVTVVLFIFYQSTLNPGVRKLNELVG